MSQRRLLCSSLWRRRCLQPFGSTRVFGGESCREYHCSLPMNADADQPDAAAANAPEEGTATQQPYRLRKFGPQRPVLTNLPGRLKFKIAAEKLFKAAAAKDAPPGDAGAVDQPDVISISPTPHVKSKALGKTAAFIMEILNKEAVAEAKQERKIPELRPGYVVRLKVEVLENKRRIQEYKGIIIAMHKNGIHTTFRIRRQLGSSHIEHVLPLYSPLIKEFEILDRKRVRRAKLYYLREGRHKLKSIKVKKRDNTEGSPTSSETSSGITLPPPPAE